jgi:glycyl-tRNA synthetase
VTSALAQLRELAPKMLKDARLEFNSIDYFATPRRQGFIVHNLAPQQTPLDAMVRGPALKAAFDKDGKPTKAAEGFARGQGVDVKDLLKVEEKGNQYVYAKKHDVGNPAGEVLSTLLLELVAALKFEKTMRWASDGVAFSRPLRWFVALWKDQVVPFRYAEISSGNVTRGPRAEGSPNIVIASADQYQATLKQHNVILDYEERREVVRAQIDKVAESAHGQIPDDPGLLEEVTNLVEEPTALLGSFEQKYLALPKDVLITVMKKHQRYFPVLGKSGMLPHFIAVRNGNADHLDIVQRGNEEVLRARYSDAEYFFNHDRKHKLEEFLPKLSTMTFQVKLGSMLDKAKRIEALTPTLATMLKLDEKQVKAAQRAAYLSKADLGSQMVVEMTSLQGIMGREYARLSGENDVVANALAEQYDRAPESIVGAVISLADRFDSLSGLFAVGLAPTGSADPWALRRAALGIVETLIKHQASFSLRSALAAAAKLQPVAVETKALDDAHAFLVGRERAALLDQGLRYDLVDAVLAARGDDPFEAKQSIEALTAEVAKPDWSITLDNYARCVRIVRDIKEMLLLDIGKDNDPQTRALYKAYDTAHQAIGPQSSIGAFFKALAPLIPVIQTFFDKVLVMHEDPSIRQTRQALLQHIWHLADGIVDLSKVEGF